jgi:poly-gamma-glutamate capsule biosynthesis protein CapA/YwtB (metallophosphatase superfamily)
MTPRRTLTGAVLAGLLVGGCTAAPEPETAPDEPTTAASADPTGTPSTGSPSPAEEPTQSASTEPLVLAIPLHRAPLDLTRRRAERFADGGGPAWVDAVPASRLDASAAVATVAGVDPLLDPEGYPLRVPGPAPGRVTTLRVVGDIMLGRGVAAAHGNRDPVAALKPLADHLAGADLTVGNLESTLSTAGPPQQGGDSFAVPPSTPRALARLGLDAVSLANNHTGDFGTRALLETVAGFGPPGLRAFGAGRDRAAASRPLVLRRHGVGFGFVGFNAIGETPAASPATPGALSVRMPPRTGPLNRADLAHVLGVVRRLDRRADVVVALPHWGTQYTHVAEPVQSLVGRRLIDAGADLVVGGHPHWVQGLEHVTTDDGGAVLAHSLGNLVFDMDFMEQTMEGATLTATFWGDRLMRVALSPYRMDATFSPRLVDGPVADGILSDVWRNSTGPFRGP